LSDPQDPCLPHGRTGHKSIYVGQDKKGEHKGEITYVGETHKDKKQREQEHLHKDKPPRDLDISLLYPRWNYSQELAWAIEKYLWQLLSKAGYHMTNDERTLKPALGNRCHDHLMQLAKQEVEQEGMWEQIQRIAPPPPPHD
jgi:hypothetical protein